MALKCVYMTKMSSYIYNVRNFFLYPPPSHMQARHLHHVSLDCGVKQKQTPLISQTNRGPHQGRG